MSNLEEPNAVEVVTTPVGTSQFKIVAKATFNCAPEQIWKLLWDWEQLLAVGLPGVTENFQWLNGSPDHIPSSFQFEIGGVIIKEEIYERKTKSVHRLRYRTLGPALGVVDYDAIIDLHPISNRQTVFLATRVVTFEPGVTPDMLADMVRSETKNLQTYFSDSLP